MNPNRTETEIKNIDVMLSVAAYHCRFWSNPCTTRTNNKCFVCSISYFPVCFSANIWWCLRSDNHCRGRAGSSRPHDRHTPRPTPFPMSPSAQPGPRGPSYRPQGQPFPDLNAPRLCAPLRCHNTARQVSSKS